MGRWNGMIAGVGLLLAPAALAAQAPRDGAAMQAGAAAAVQPAPSQVVERMFAYLEPRLRVEIVGEAPGSIQLLRGENGVMQITASVPSDGSLPAVARSAQDELTLLANGAGPVQYVVVVPRDATVTVARAGQPAVAMPTLDRSARWTWPAGTASSAELPH